MAIWGKLIGGVAGMALGGPLGGLLGAAAGHAVDRLRRSTVRVEGAFSYESLFVSYTEKARRLTFTLAVVALAGKMARVDGPVCREEMNAFARLFPVPLEDQAGARRLFESACATASGFEIHARQIAMLYTNTPDVLDGVLEILFAIAIADGPLHETERAFLGRVSVIFGKPDKTFGTSQVSHGDDPYRVLGIARTASPEEIRGAYRRLLREYHPDLLAGRGVSEDSLRAANRTMAAINAAFDHIMRERGLR
ncbi:MAG: hypothetical protein FD149_1295 [Rhodospirillaceae bacterium]|nr:MAG: hypothetical protein FD149_1295 [Rhodospirillaceae bacterium]